jgi:tripartite-type tricarboxylate transporter receptor subunit TctC
MRAVGFISAIAAIFLGALPHSALAQNDYPNRPISLIVPYAAGGVADVAMRLLGDKLSNRLGQQFVIENRPGAGGIVAAQAAASAQGDGYTLLMTGNNTAIAAALFKSLPYNVLTDFASISTAALF